MKVSVFKEIGGREMDKRGGNTMSDLNNVIHMLDSMTAAGVSRIKVEVSDAVEEGRAEKAYHHGRCDVGSPFATGRLYDLEEDAGESE